MKILLLSLNWKDSEELGAMTDASRAMPIEYTYVSSVLFEKNIDHDFIDLWVRNQKIEDIENELINYDIVVINSAPSYLFWRDGVKNIKQVVKAAKKVKEIHSKCFTLLVGPHGTVLPATFDDSGLDAIIRGEPDFLVYDVAKSLMETGKVETAPGIHVAVNGKFEGEVESIEIPDLTALPPMRYDKFKFEDYPHPRVYGDVPAGSNTVIYEASRGCPFSCSYCFKVGFRDKFREKSEEQIDRELGELKAKGVNYIYLIDEIFLLKKDWSIKILSLLKKHQMKWGCQTRPSLLKPEIVDAIIESGTAGLIQIGLEHTDSEVLKAMRKNETDVDMLADALHRLTEHDISIDLFLVTGLPKDTPEKLQSMSKDFRKFPLDKIHWIIHVAMPLPQTPLWDLAIKEGANLNGWDDIEENEGLIQSGFRDMKHIQVESFILSGKLNVFRDLMRIKKAPGKIINYLKLTKHFLDTLLPRLMMGVTAKLSELRKEKNWEKALS